MMGICKEVTKCCEQDFLPNVAPSCTPQIIDNAYPPEMKVVGFNVTYTYRCNEGYMMLHNSSTLHCINGQLHGDSPVCTSEWIIIGVEVVYNRWMYFQPLAGIFLEKNFRGTS